MRRSLIPGFGDVSGLVDTPPPLTHPHSHIVTPQGEAVPITFRPREFNQLVRVKLRPNWTFKIIGPYLKGLVKGSVLSAMMSDSSNAVFKKYKFISSATLKEHKLHIKSSKPITHIQSTSTNMAYKKYKGRRRYRRRRRTRVPRHIQTKPPESCLVKLNSIHQGYFDPGASGQVAYTGVNINDPTDPLLAGVAWTMHSTEHHPKYWDHYANIYDRYQVISARVVVEFMSNVALGNHSVFMLPVSGVNSDEAVTMIADTGTFGPRLREAYRRAIVKFAASSTNDSQYLKLSRQVNISKLEGTKDKAELQAATAASSTESSPTRTPKIYFGVGSMYDTVDLSAVTCVIKIEQVIRFSNLTGDAEGAAV